MQYDYERQPDKVCSKCRKKPGTHLVVGGHHGVTNLSPLFCLDCCPKVIREVKTGRTTMLDVQR